jgi:4-amino-4-deoxy-L-arabinose transferase-like glycosyltransferase
MALPTMTGRETATVPHIDGARSLSRLRGGEGVRQSTIVLVLMVIALIKQVVLALTYPPFQGHDEIAHLGYARVVAFQQRLPTLHDSLTPDLIPWTRFGLDWPALYTANHPPLYYLLATPVIRIAGSGPLEQLFLLRLLSIPFFLLTVWFAWLLTTTIFPSDRFLALTVPTVIAMQPQLSLEGAIVNNDILSICIGAGLLYLLARVVVYGFHDRDTLAIGAVLGLALLTKATLTTFVLLAVAAVAWRSWRDHGALDRGRQWLRATAARLALILIPAGVIALPWYVFLYRTYGDLTAFRALEALQASWGPPRGTVAEMLLSREFQRERLLEGWGYFGWKLVPLTAWEAGLVYIVTALAIIGLVLGITRNRCWLTDVRARAHDPLSAAVALLAGSIGLMYAAMLYFGTISPWTQARYMFPIAPAVALLAMLGYRELVAPERRNAGAAVIVFAAVAMQVLLLTRLVLPYAS